MTNKSSNVFENINKRDVEIKKKILIYSGNHGNFEYFLRPKYFQKSTFFQYFFSIFFID